jgi:tetratricopeptide (TPR) repeat protein
VQQKIEQVATQAAPTEEELSAEEYFSTAVEKHLAGDLDGAIANYGEVLRLNPEHADAHYNQGAAHYHKGDFDSAIADYSEALRLNPNDAGAYSDRGEVNFASGRFDKALDDFRQANQLRPAYNMTLGGLAITLYELDQPEEAKRIWKTLVAQDQRFKDADWVGVEFRWVKPLIEAARKLIAEL